MKVKKRTGAIVPFDKKYISSHQPGGGCRRRADESMETETTDMIEQKLKESGEDIIEIETIQDMVEECLFEQQSSAQLKRIFCTEEKKNIQEKSGSPGFFPENF